MNLEEKVIPNLIAQSNMVAMAMGLPTSNCSCSAGNVWDEKLVFEQEFNGSAHAYNWGMPFLNDITRIGDSVMLSKTLYNNIATQKKRK